jgi:hypothetical protein
VPLTHLKVTLAMRVNGVNTYGALRYSSYTQPNKYIGIRLAYEARLGNGMPGIMRWYILASHSRTELLWVEGRRDSEGCLLQLLSRAPVRREILTSADIGSHL